MILWVFFVQFIMDHYVIIAVISKNAHAGLYRSDFMEFVAASSRRWKNIYKIRCSIKVHSDYGMIVSEKVFFFKQSFKMYRICKKSANRMMYLCDGYLYEFFGYKKLKDRLINWYKSSELWCGDERTFFFGAIARLS